jgi:AcrR family transcriptional regulator
MAQCVIRYSSLMSRWQPDAQRRLERAALELFAKQGFADTTVPQIAARAGLTNRTFFRYFADKREVLFTIEAEFPGRVAQVVASAPTSSTPMPIVRYGAVAVAAAWFEDQREYLTLRRAIIQSDDGLKERELSKQAALTQVVTDGFIDLGFGHGASLLSAHLFMTVLGLSVDQWLDDAGRSLVDCVHDTLRVLETVTSDGAD